MDRIVKAGEVVSYNVVTGATPARLDGGTQRSGVLSGVLVCAPVANGAAVFIGGSDVTVANGIELAAGQRQFFSSLPSDLWVVSAAPQNLRVMLQ